MNWIDLIDEIALSEAIDKSYHNKGIIIFKHSTRCSISSVAKTRLSLSWNFKDELPAYHLDLIKFRELSNLIATQFDVYHESPQLLFVKDGKCTYNSSHLSISVKNLQAHLQ